MKSHHQETIESEAHYKGFRILLSTVGNFFTSIFGVLYMFKSLKDTTDAIDTVRDHQKN